VLVVNSTLTLFIAFIPKSHQANRLRASRAVLSGFILFSLAWICAIFRIPNPSPEVIVSANIVGILAIAQFCLYPWHRADLKAPIAAVAGLSIAAAGIMTYLILSDASDALRVHAFNLMLSVFAVIATAPIFIKRYYQDNLGDRLFLTSLWIYCIIIVSRSLLIVIAGADNPYSIFLVFVGTAFFSVAVGGSTLTTFSYDVRNELYEQSISDPMTGLLNRRGFVSDSQKVLSASNRHHYPVSVVICDLDYFKRVNDSFGHQVGDQAIVAFTKIITESLRSEDIAARLGGEEFIIVLPHTNGEIAVKVAERIRKRTEEMCLDTSGGPLHLTASFGVTQFNHVIDLDTLIRYADNALYCAKNGGRNQVFYSIDGEDASPMTER
jgi:diguanylate cyclase (GGDEF)-like protein